MSSIYVKLSRFDAQRLDSKYFCLALNQNVSRYVAQAQGGVGLAHITKSKFLDSLIPIAPKTVQLALVAEIEKQFSRLDEAVANLKRVKANLKRYKAAVLKSAVEGRLVPTEAELARREGRSYESGAQLLQCILAARRANWTGKGEYKEPVSPLGGEYPEGWVPATIRQLSISSFYGPRFSSDQYASSGPFVLRTTDIDESGHVSIETAPRISLSSKELERYRVTRGDLLVTRTGSLGTVALFDDVVDAIPGAYLIQLRLRLDWAAHQYLFLCLKSPAGRAYLTRGGAGVGRPNLNAPTIEAYSLGLPPLAEQRRIVAEVDRRLSLAQEMEFEVDCQLLRAEALRHAALTSAFPAGD